MKTAAATGLIASLLFIAPACAEPGGVDVQTSAIELPLPPARPAQPARPATSKPKASPQVMLAGTPRSNMIWLSMSAF